MIVPVISVERRMIKVAVFQQIHQAKRVAQYLRCGRPTGFFVPIPEDDGDPCCGRCANLLFDGVLDVKNIFSILRATRAGGGQTPPAPRNMAQTVHHTLASPTTTVYSISNSSHNIY